MTHEDYMQMAIAAAAGEIPVGAVVVCGDTVLAAARNDREETHSPLGHAEVRAIEMACRVRGDWRLEDCTLYVTLEPCPMCAGGIISARIPEVYYGAKDAGFGACGSILNLFEEEFRHHPKLRGRILEEECKAVLQEFFRGMR